MARLAATRGDPRACLAGLRPLLARAPTRSACQRLSASGLAVPLEEMGGAPRDPPKRTKLTLSARHMVSVHCRDMSSLGRALMLRARSAYVREHILLRNAGSRTLN